MSGFSGSTTCPNCGKECDEYTDSKPFSMTTMQCNYCGLLINPVDTIKLLSGVTLPKIYSFVPTFKSTA